MRVMGFCEKLIEWMILCMKTVSSNICFNGSYIGHITPKRGLRQADPLSPYIFLLCIEGFSSGGIHECGISPSAPVIYHLLFTNNSFLFFKETMEEAATVKALLIDYERCSSQSMFL